MSTFKRIALFAALFAAQVALACSCHAQEAADHHIVATADYPDGVKLVLTDRQVGSCRAAASLPPNVKIDDDREVVGCWALDGGQVRITFLLGSEEDDVKWVETYSLRDFRLTGYGLHQAKQLTGQSPT